MDGSGYPDRLEAESISITAKITSIVDVFDALTTARVYQAAFARRGAAHHPEEVKKGWWEGRLFEEFWAVLEALPQNGLRYGIRTMCPGGAQCAPGSPSRMQEVERIRSG